MNSLSKKKKKQSLNYNFCKYLFMIFLNLMLQLIKKLKNKK